MNSTETNTRTVLVVEPFKPPHVKTIPYGLEVLQKIVGGTIQAVYPFDDLVGIICNDEGKLLGLPWNRALYDGDGRVYDIIAGTFIVAGLGDGDFTSLSPELLEKYMFMYRRPEIFRLVRGTVLVKKI